LPIPGANESSTVEWQRAQVMPIEVSEPPSSKMPLTPTTAFSLSSASVVAGLLRSTRPFLRFDWRLPGRASTVDLQAGDGKGRNRAYTRADASEGGALNRLVKLEHATPVVLVAEGVEAEDFLALIEQLDQCLRAPLARRVDRLRLARTGCIVSFLAG
jgi:hypothetical protein